MKRIPISRMNLDQANEIYSVTKKKINGQMNTMSYSDRINDKRYNDLFIKLDSIASRIKFLTKQPNEKPNDTTPRVWEHKRKGVGISPGGMARA